jgi:diguanylate cyclase (GGDEF)-like protein
MTGEAEARFEALAEHSEVLLALYDAEDRLRRANSAFRQTFAIGPEEQPSWAEMMRRNLGTAHGTVVTARDFEGWLTATRARRGKQPFRAFETDTKDGRWFWMTETVDRAGWMLCIATEISALRIGQRRLRQDRDFAQRASQTDDLTGLPNRRSMMQRLEALACPAAQPEDGFCIGLLDIDFFKRINDEHGHQMGDAVLLDFARRLVPMLRRWDVVGRVGGEEFLLLLPDTRLEAAMALMEGILAMLRRMEGTTLPAGLGYHCSAGLAAFIPGETATALYARADAALYAAKRGGRNRLEVAPGP